MSKSIAIYSRKSRFTGKGDSIENQKELCRQYIENNYSNEAPLDIFIYEDEGFSGKNTARPQLKTMLQDAARKKFSLIICYRLDRISRNVSDFANMIENLNKLEVAFVSIKETFDTSTPMGRAMMYIACVFAQLERETIAERIRDNMYELSKSGRWLGGTTPTGYISESFEKLSADGLARKVCQLKKQPEEAQIIEAIFQRYMKTGSLTETEAFLMQSGYASKNKVNFSRYAIRSILTNPVYMIADEEAYLYIKEKNMNLYADKKDFDGRYGITAYNRTKQSEGKTHEIRNVQEWIMSVGRHEGIISGKDFAKVQELLNINKSKTYKKARSNTALLSGLIYCGKCGNRMRPKMTRRYTAEGERIYDYLCLMKEKSKSRYCSINNPNGNILDNMVCEKLFGLEEDAPTFIAEFNKLDKNIKENTKACNTYTDRFKKLLAENEKEINILVNMLGKVSGNSAEQYIVKQINELHDKGDKLRKQMIEADYINQELTSNEMNSLKLTMHEFKSLFKASNVEHKRRAIRSIIEKVVWDGTKVEIFLPGSY